MSWRAARVRGAVVHALASVRERAGVRAGDLASRAASARARLAWRLKRGTQGGSELVTPLLLSAAVAGLAFLLFRSAWSALAAGGWTFAIALLLALRSAQQRHALALQYELHELRRQLQEELTLQLREELRQQLHVAHALVQPDELEEIEEIDPHDEPTRAGPTPKRTGPAWGRCFGLHWPSWRS